MADELVRIAEDSVRGSFFLISGTAVSTVIMAIASILIARFLGPELYGQYTLALVIPSLLFLFTDLPYKGIFWVGQGLCWVASILIPYLYRRRKPTKIKIPRFNAGF